MPPTGKTKAVEGLTPRLQGLYYIVWLAIQRGPGRSIRHDRGHATKLVLDKCKIPDTDANRNALSTVIRALVDDGVITRDYNEGQKRTYAIILVDGKGLSEDQIARIHGGRKKVLDQFTAPEKESAPAGSSDTGKPDASFDQQLFDDCQRAHAALLAATATARTASRNGKVNVSVTGELAAIGIGTDYSEEIRYYLRRLGLAKNAGKVRGTRRYWWIINEGIVDAAALMKLVNSEESFETDRARRGVAVNPNRRSSEPTPAPQATGSGSPTVVAASPKSPTVSVETPSAMGAKMAGEALESGSVAELLGIIQELLDENTTLRAQLGPQSTVADRARSLIARHNTGG
jgi:hypothetical protein